MKCPHPDEIKRWRRILYGLTPREDLVVPALNHTVPRHDGDPTLSYDLGSLCYDIAYQPNWFKSVPYNAFRISAVWIRHAVVPRTSSRCLLSQPTTGSKLLAPRRLVAFCLVLYSYRSNSAAGQMVALHHDRRQIGRMEEFDRHGILHQERAGRQGNHSNAHAESKHWDDSARL